MYCILCSQVILQSLSPSHAYQTSRDYNPLVILDLSKIAVILISDGDPFSTMIDYTEIKIVKMD